MIRPLRRSHRRQFLILALLIPIAFASALFFRAPTLDIAEPLKQEAQP